MELGDALTWNTVGTGVRIGGSLFGAFQNLSYGEQAQDAAAFQAAQLRQNAGQALAQAQRDAYFEQRKTDYVMSAALASAAASGGGASDPTVVNILSQISAEGAYRKASALYGGEDRSRMFKLQADSAEYAGEAANTAAIGRAIGSGIDAAASLAGGMQKEASLFQRFAGKGPDKDIF